MCSTVMNGTVRARLNYLSFISNNMMEYVIIGRAKFNIFSCVYIVIHYLLSKRAFVQFIQFFIECMDWARVHRIGQSTEYFGTYT